MKVIPTKFPEVNIVEPSVHEDVRGYLVEVRNAGEYAKLGMNGQFVQENVSKSKRGVLRGLHFQNPFPQGKLITVLDGNIFDVVVDVRRGSPSFGVWQGCSLNAATPRQLWVPPGFAHGFLVTSDAALVSYSCSAPYKPASEHTLAWNAPDISIEWPFLPHLLSAKDSSGKTLRELEEEGALPDFSL